MKLIAHPDHPPRSVTGVDVSLQRNGDRLHLDYVVTGAGALVLPAPAKPARTDGLWQHSCFELFARPGSGVSYDEFNFAPSGAWAAYRFEAYRAGMSDLPVAAPGIEGARDGDRYVQRVRVEVPGLMPGWRIGLSAVIEEAEGVKSYWALAHPAGRPDFHHEDCFALELPAPERA